MRRYQVAPYMVNYWLAKQEPRGLQGYPLSQLEQDGQTVWDGVHNNLALKHMQQMLPELGRLRTTFNKN